MPAWTITLVAIAGALGALARTGLSEAFGGELLEPSTLAVTLVINTVGAALLALLRRYGPGTLSSPLVTALGIGFLGSFTTWSAVIAVVAIAGGTGQLLLAIGYLVVTLVLGIGVALIARGPVAQASQ